MSKYSTELRYIIDSGFDLGMNDYPIFSNEYRTQLNNKIFNHYFFNEIGFETVERFKFYLNTTMSEIMPYYNKMYQSELLIINPLLSFQRSSNAEKTGGNTVNEDLRNTIVKAVDDVTTQHVDVTSGVDNVTTSATDETQTNTGGKEQTDTLDSTKNVDANNSDSATDVESDSPQSMLSYADITANKYASKANKKVGANVVDEAEVVHSVDGIIETNHNTNVIDNDVRNVSNTDSTSNTVNSTVNGLDENTTNNNINLKTLTLNETNVVTENGFEIPISDLVLKYRDTFLNVDMMIIEKLKDLFMMIY